MRQLMTRGWLLTHALAVGMILVLLDLGRWQWHRAESGNTPSYAYALEWPTFALLVIGFWIKIVRDELHPNADPAPEAATAAEPTLSAVVTAAPQDEDEAELATYNRYLAESAAATRRARLSGGTAHLR